ncbi:hypothetical protein CCL24_03385 [Pseudomonas congelans]|nr:hypothetical protein CCL24_03385 [Pseudomonas congelans]PBQ14862.1 hypothetical protein CCL08_19725 [Pseudomonas congelans]
MPWRYLLKQYRGLIVFFITVVSVFALLQVWHARVAPEEAKQERERKLTGMAKYFDIGTPKMLDDSVRLDSVKYKDGTMRISYTLTKQAKSEIDSEEFTKQARVRTIGPSCNEKGLGPFVRSGLIINYKFNDSSDSPISEFQIEKSDCL